jgi:hypothetical protein
MVGTAALTDEFAVAPAITAQLLQGQAEIFGAEMAPKRWYHFLAECKAAIFSWDGCQIEMSPRQPSAVSNEAPRVVVAELEERGGGQSKGRRRRPAPSHTAPTWRGGGSRATTTDAPGRPLVLTATRGLDWRLLQ